MPSERLEKLADTGLIKREAFSRVDFDGLLVSGKRRLADARNKSLSLESRFDLAYNASHALGLAALRWHGYRADKRFIVFQCLTQTLDVPAADWRVLQQAHDKRNTAEYDGTLDVSEALLASMIRVTEDIGRRCEALELPPP